MFSFRTTSLSEQEDLVLHYGKLGVLSNAVAWNPETGEYLFEQLSKSGHLSRIFVPNGGFFNEYRSDNETYTDAEDFCDVFGLDNIDFVQLPTSNYEYLLLNKDKFEGIDALIIEFQDLGVRYNPILSLVYNIFKLLKEEDMKLSVYVLDRENPSGRQVEGTALDEKYLSEIGLAGMPQTHGLTLGELSNLFYFDLNGKFPLHIISFLARSATKYMNPWSISPFSDLPGMYTFSFFSGQYLWEGTNVNPGKGTNRPFELFGAPFLKDFYKKSRDEKSRELLNDLGAFVRWTEFIPLFGKYKDQRCYGYQLIQNSGIQYHSLAHTLRIMKYVKDNSTDFEFNDKMMNILGDDVLMDYLESRVSWNDLKEHIKVEEQKWIRKAKRYLLYDENLWRVKTLL
ncbi:MAG: exo-beta-N-acetylmuramidase NamZ domain-containing protein [Bacteroidales bacterium]